MRIIDYDEIETWGRWLGAAIAEIAPPGLLEELKAGDPEFIEDAADFLLKRLGSDVVVKHLLDKFAPAWVRVYHGTRLTGSEDESVRAHGLKPLRLVERSSTLISIFREHPKWPGVEEKLAEALQRFGAGNVAGKREDGCVHVCFSRGIVAGLQSLSDARRRG